MERVIQAYGKFLLEAVTVVFLWVLLFTKVTDDQGNRGVFHIIGSCLEQEEPGTDRTDFESFQSESQKSKPVMTYLNTGILHVGSYELNGLIKAEDYAGEELVLKVKSICDPSGEEQIAEYPDDISKLYLSDCGIYTLTVAATDSWNRTSICRFRIPVTY